MIRRSLLVCSLLAAALPALAACGDDQPPKTAADPAVVTSMPPATVEPAKMAEAPPPPPSADEMKKAQSSKELEADRVKWSKDLDAMKARWTLEMHAEAKTLSDKAFPSAKVAINAAVAAKYRSPENAARDKYRHPAETLEFFGVKPTSKVVDIGPGEGWYTEILAPMLAKSGVYFATGSDPNGPAEARGTFYAQKFQGFLSTSPEAYGKVKPIVVDGKAPALSETVDFALIFRGVHGMKNNGSLDAWLKTIHDHLAPNGVLGIEEHRAAPGANVDESAKQGYMPERWVIDTIEAAGFKLAGKSEVSANPKDTKDYAEGVWTLPPSLRLGEKDRAKYLAIGESDRMTLKFTKKSAAARVTKK